jgi:hypothetical protein
MNRVTCAKCETEIPNSAVRYRGRAFHFACSPLFEMLVELRLDYDSLKRVCAAEAEDSRLSELEALIPAMRESAQDTLDALHRRGFRITSGAG